MYLKPIDKKDIKIIKRWFEDNELVSFAFGIMAESDILEKIADEYLKDFIKSSDEVLGICLKENSQLIGFVNFVYHSRLNDTSRIGIIIGEEQYRSLGFGTEAMLVVLYYLFEKKGLKRINLDTADFNIRAQNCFKKCGFQNVGEITEINFLTGELIHKHEMMLTREDFLSNVDKIFLKLPEFEGSFPG